MRSAKITRLPLEVVKNSPDQLLKLGSHVRIWSWEHCAYLRPNWIGYTSDGLLAGIYEPSDAYSRVAHFGDDARIDFIRVDEPRPAPTPDDLYEALKHGDDVHREWLRDALHAVFEGNPVPEPRQSQPRPAVPGEAEESELISQRDYWEARATELAQRAGEHFGFDVGEHSNLNCPVLNALESKWERPAVPEADAYILVFEDQKRENLTFSGHGARQAAIDAYHFFDHNWSVILFASVTPESAQQPEGGE